MTNIREISATLILKTYIKKKMKQIITHFTDTDLYTFSVCLAVLENFPRAHVSYEFFDRNSEAFPDGFADELNKQNYTNELLKQYNKFALSVLDKEVDGEIIKIFGFNKQMLLF